MTQQRRNKLAVIGAGNAGCISALHCRLFQPDLEIDLYHDAEHHPIERVGQGTIIPVAQLLSYSLYISSLFNSVIS